MSPADKLSKAKLAAEAKRPTRKSRPLSVPVFDCNIHDRRTGLKLTIRDVSDATGLTPACISVVERGSNVELATAFKVAAFFGCEIKEIWTPVKKKGGR